MTSSERELLAQELHDGVAQDLVAIGYSLDLIIGDPKTVSETKVDLRKVRFNISGLIEKVRHEIHDLYRQSSEDLLTQIRFHVESLSLNLSVSVVDGAENIELDSDRAFHVLRIVSELLRNIDAHSGATACSIKVRQLMGNCLIEITDNGKGDFSHDGSRYGITGASQRTSLISGTLGWTHDIAGTVTLLTLPTNRASNT